MSEVSLLVDDQVFKADKDVLCQHSDYFRAMFSGSYVENDKQEISIHNSIADKVLRYLKRLFENHDLSAESIVSTKTEYTETVYTETLNLFKESKSRCIKYTPVMSVLNLFQLEFYKVTEQDVELWQVLPGFSECYGPLPYTGRMVVSWGLTKLVVIKENNKSIWVYDVLMKDWTCHGDGLWSGCFDGAVVVEDSLYLLTYSLELKRFLTTIYDLKGVVFVTMEDCGQDYCSDWKLASVCVHEGSIYAAYGLVVYKREGLGSTDRWSTVDFEELGVRLRVNRIVSFKGYIYFTTKATMAFYRCRLTQEFPVEKLYFDPVTTLNQQAIPICSLGDRLIFLSYLCGGFIDGTLVTGYYGNDPKEKLKTLHAIRNIEIGNIVSCCPLLMEIPLYNDISNYVKEHLKKYEAILYE